MQVVGDSTLEAMIQEKVKILHIDLLKDTLGMSAESDLFKASRRWLDKYKKRSGTHSIMKHGEAASSNKVATDIIS